ncbi:MAG: hypothetical protein R3224_01445 [Balneolaceae bacterium]|nr:hypothetical protein [Balneolaceae bacterium]
MKWSLYSISKTITALAATLILFVAAGCGTTEQAAGDDLGDLDSFQVEKSGAILWGENCSRCHNTPDPSAFSDVQWEAIGTHMRIRAGLTAKDARKIIEFLQQSN